MQTTLRIKDEVYREAKAAAARQGMTMTKFIEAALSEKIDASASNGREKGSSRAQREIAFRNRLMEALLRKTAHFRVGPRPTREEMNER